MGRFLTSGRYPEFQPARTLQLPALFINGTDQYHCLIYGAQLRLGQIRFGEVAVGRAIGAKHLGDSQFVHLLQQRRHGCTGLAEKR